MRGELDLHGFTVKEGQSEVLEYMTENGTPSKIITGCGPLQEGIRNWLEEYDIQYLVPQYNMGVILILD